jgi:GlpG protein
MRIIGHIPNKDNAAVFSDFLYVQGITNVIEQEKDGWAVWIHSEDELDNAKTMLRSFLANPADPEYAAKARKATALKEREMEEEEKAAEKYFDRDRAFSTTLPYGVGPVTALLILASIVVTVCASYGIGRTWLEGMMFSNYIKGAPEILKGEIWRLVTPIFFHASLRSPVGVLHIFFNALWLYTLGSAIEQRHSSRWLLIFTVLVAALSNLGQYLYTGPNFGGLSGIVYALLGYIWIRGKFDPDFGLGIPPQTVTMMIIWYFLCLFEFIPNVANTVHTIGLIAGMGWGFITGFEKS